MEEKEMEVLGMRFTWDEFLTGLVMTLALLAIIGIGDAIGNMLNDVF